MLELRHLQVSYGHVQALRGLSISVQAGEIVGLIGPNGAGKTTALSAIFGLLKLGSGTITFEGQSLVGRRPEDVVRLGVGLVPEGRHIFGTLSVKENLSLGATTRSDRSRVHQDMAQTFDRFPVLERYLDSPAWQLSGGEQQQLAIARALLSKPRLLLLDEPSLGLAPTVIDLVFRILDELRTDGVTILLVEQNAARAVELADRCYVLRSGTLVLEGRRDELLSTADFGAVYLGEGLAVNTEPGHGFGGGDAADATSTSGLSRDLDNKDSA